MADWLHVKNVKGSDVSLNLGNVSWMERTADNTTLISFLGGTNITVTETPAQLLADLERVQRERKERRAGERRAKSEERRASKSLKRR